MIAKTIKKLLAVLFIGSTFSLLACGMSVSAQTYATEYPDVYNSGSPLWFTCEVKNRGNFVVLIDPNTNLQSFGFDGERGYNLINNTGETIYGRAYDLESSNGYLVRFPSYYCMQFKVPNNDPQYTWQDVYINNITGTTLDFIDYHGTRGNDNLQYTTDQKISIIIFVAFVLGIMVYIGRKIWRA